MNSYIIIKALTFYLQSDPYFEKMIRDLSSGIWKWSGTIIDETHEKDKYGKWVTRFPRAVGILPELELTVLRKDGLKWDYNNRSLFCLWENLYDHAVYRYGKDTGPAFRAYETYYNAPELFQCYNRINYYWNYK